jgi:hypothetical protein
MSDNVIPISGGAGGGAKDLRETIEHMDALSQEAFSEIDAIALLIERVIEAPDSRQAIVQMAIATAAGAIRRIATDNADRINGAAEAVGCNRKS